MSARSRNVIVRRILGTATLSLVVFAGAVPAPVGAGAPACAVTNARTGTSHPNLGRALRSADPGDTLRLQGTCPGGVTIGKDITIRGVAPDGNTPRLDGAGQVLHVVRVRPGVTVTLRSLTIQGGIADGAVAPGDSGGGILNEGALTLRDVIVRDNVASHRGGGIRSAGTLLLVDSEVRDNTIVREGTPGEGCGIHSSGRLTLRGTSRVHRSQIQGSCVGSGIAVTGGSSLVMEGASSVADNATHNADGAGVAVLNGSLTMRDRARIENNSARGSGRGGGVYVGPGSTLTLRSYSAISENDAYTGGGIASEGTVRLFGSASVDRNWGLENGGGVHVIAGSLTLEGTAGIVNNDAFEDGGGVLLEGSLTMDRGNRIAYNAAGDAGGLWVGCLATTTGVDWGANVASNTPNDIVDATGC